MAEQLKYYLGTNVELPLHLQDTIKFPQLSDDSFLSIEGWFEAPQAYFISKIIDSLPDGSSIVEIGPWMGRSTRFIAQYLKDKNRKIKYTVIDTFKGSPKNKLETSVAAKFGGTVRDQFYINITSVKDYITVIEEDSNKAFEQLSDNSVDVILIDGDPSFEFVRDNIFNYYPKVKLGGIICGTNYKPPAWGVFHAVPVMLGALNTNIFGEIWWSLKHNNPIMRNKIGYTD